MAGISLFWAVTPVRDFSEGDYEWVEVIFELGGYWGGWVILFRVGHLDWIGLGGGSLIWAGVPLF